MHAYTVHCKQRVVCNETDYLVCVSVTSGPPLVVANIINWAEKTSGLLICRVWEGETGDERKTKVPPVSAVFYANYPILAC